MTDKNPKELSVNDLKALAYDKMAEVEMYAAKIENIQKVLRGISVEIKSREENKEKQPD